ncbi:hypothetical protein [Dokdonella soli]|uniref:TolC family protein n=1 Tax=Dokdonella soli TaxID=529810 RepID=A0ABN1ITV8_9GAMM
MADCPLIVQDGVAAIVDNAYTTYSAYAGAAFTMALKQAEALQAFQVGSIPANVSLALPTAWFQYVRPAAPQSPDLSYHPDQTKIPDVAVTPYQAFTPGNAPTDNSQAPAISLPPQPGALTATAPGDPPVLPSLVVPAAPSITFPNAPALRDIALPTPPSITLPTFQGVRPTSNLVAPAVALAFTPTDYTDTLLTSVKATIATMLQGGTGLPSAVVQALRDRAYASQDILETRAVQQAYEELSSRGFSEPNGLLQRRLAEIRQTNQNLRSGLSRDIYIKDQEIAVENLRFSVQQGIAIESALLVHHVEFMRLSLQAAQFALQASIDVFDAQVKLFNANLQAYSVDAQVYRDKLQAALTQVEIYKAEVDAQKLIGDINQQAVQIYAERVKALLATVEVYTAQVNGVRAQAEANATIIEAFRAKVTAYAEQVRAYTAQWEGYRAAVDGQLSLEKIYETSVNAYSTRVRAWSEQNTVGIESKKLELQSDQLTIDVWKAKLERYMSALDAEVKRLDAVTRGYAGQVDAFRAQATVEQVAAEVSQKGVELAITAQNNQAQVALKNAEIAIQELVQTTNLLIEAKKSAATVEAQLAASALSAVNFSARIGSELSQQQSCSQQTAFTYFGTAPST